MGSSFSLHARKSWIEDNSVTSQSEASEKRLRMSSSYNDENLRLFPNLPDEISLQILARVPRIHYLSLKLVSRRWKATITSPELYQLRRELGTSEEWLYVLLNVKEGQLIWYALDPMSRKWQKLPPMPDVSEDEPKRVSFGSLVWNMLGLGSSIKISDVLRGWLERRDVADKIPFCGCSTGAVGGCLYMLGGFSKATAMKCVWRYDPCLNLWQEVSSMSTGRAFCKTSLLNSKLYVVGGVCRDRGGLTPIRSAEVYEPCTGQWTQVENIPFSKTVGIPTAFLADLLKPIATGMTSYRGRLCVPQSSYTWPFFVGIGGEIYDPETDSWEEMPAGMGDGWPATQAGTKLGVVVEGELYTLDPCNSLDSGKIKIYDHQEDAWKVVIGDVPVRDFTDSESPYLLASLFGKLHVITTDVNNDTFILQANLHRHTISSPATSSSPSNSTCEYVASPVEEQSDLWKVVATKNFGVAELVSCQVLDV